MSRVSRHDMNRFRPDAMQAPRASLATPPWFDGLRRWFASPMMVLGLLGYFVALQTLYHWGVAPYFSYMGLVSEFNPRRMMAGVVLLLVIALFLRDDRRPSDFFLNMTMALVIVPSLVMYAGAAYADEFLLVTLTGFALMMASARLVVFGRLGGQGVPAERLMNWLLGLSAVTLVGIVAFGGARYLNFDFSEVYSIRQEAADQIPGVFGYLNPMVTKAAIPFGLVLALMVGAWSRAILFVVFSVLFFGLTAHKSPLAYPLLVAAVYYLARSRRLGQYMAFGLLAIVLLGFLDMWLFTSAGGKFSGGGGEGWYTSLLVRRTILTPAQMNGLYVEYFSDADKYWWATSKLTLGVIDTSYYLGPAQQIGSSFFGRDNMSANTGWIGSGFAQGGWFGVILYSIGIGCLLAFLDAYSRRLGPRLVISGFVVMVMIAVTTSDLLTVFTNHGLALAMVLLVLVRLPGQEPAARGRPDRFGRLRHPFG